MINKNIRNVAIIAHVDHGKTTMVDGLLKQSGEFKVKDAGEVCVMDSNPLEKERGITILAKNTAITYKDYKINIVDTPGHSDFGGEVERVLGMVEAAVLIVDAFEGPMPQTRFVLKKALEQGLKIILVINKMDRPNIRPEYVVDKVYELFIDLGASEDQIEFPIIYASGRAGWASATQDTSGENLTALFEAFVHHVPAPIGDKDELLQMQVTTIDYNEFVGRIGIGKISNGTIHLNESISVIRNVDHSIAKSRISKLFLYQGLSKIEVTEAQAGDIVAFAGVADINIGDTIADSEKPEAMPVIHIDEPTLEMTFSVNNSPFAGQEGKFVTSRQLRERLFKELETNLALRVLEGETPDSFLVKGRGELHLGILMETMRREGYEFQVSKPKVIFKEINSARYEPYEMLMLDLPEAMQGGVMEALGTRKAEMQNMITDSTGRTTLEYIIPSRGLLGFRSEFIRMTKGDGIMNHSFSDYKPYAGDMVQTRNGVLISMEAGQVTTFALQKLEDRGEFFIEPGAKVYVGMVVGENSRSQDLAINVCRAKQLTNIRSAGAEVLVALAKPRNITLEYAMEYILDDELVEVTPQNIRIRKANFKG